MSFLAVLQKEILQQLISAKFAIMTLLVVVLATVSTVVMHGDYALRLENYRLLAPDGKRTVAVKETAEMSILVKGLDESMGQVMEINVIGQIDIGRSQNGAVRLFSLFRKMDMQFVITAIMSLAAVIFSFDMVSREKRRGTLKLMLANGIGKARILLAKGIAALSLVAIPLGLALVLCLLYLQLGAGMAVSTDFYLRVLYLAFAGLVYLAVFVSIGLLISCLTHRPSTSLIFAVLGWALLVFVLPSIAAMWGESAADGDSLEQFALQERHIWAGDVFLTSQRDIERERRMEIRRNIPIRNASNYREYLNQSRERLNWSRGLNFLLPPGSFTFTAYAIAGTGPTDELLYKESVLRYQQEAVEDAATLLDVARKSPGAPKDFRARLFEPRTRPLFQALVDEVLPMALTLAVTAIVLFLLSYFAFVRYDVR
jgi:ABC-type transport system involved in multi-copper enzyme maturation permease subunit